MIGHASIALPLLAGVGVGWWLYTAFPPATDPGMLAFVLFIGVAFAITAFPVLARILSDLKLLRTPLGTTGIAAAGIGDVTAWCLLAAVVAIVRGTSVASAAIAVLLVLVFGGGHVLGRPARADVGSAAGRNPFHAKVSHLRRASSRSCSPRLWPPSRSGCTPIFGAFAAGVIMPRDSRLIGELTSKIEGITIWFMLPIFFVVVGLNTKLASLDGGMQWLACGLITAVAIATKFLGTGIAARATGSPLRDSVALGVMMNCRGLTELVVLTVGPAARRAQPGAVRHVRHHGAADHRDDRAAAARRRCPAQPVHSENRKASQHDPALL